MKFFWLATCLVANTLVNSALRLAKNGTAMIYKNTRSPVQIHTPMMIADNSEWLTADLGFTYYHWREQLGPFFTKCTTRRSKFCLKVTHVYYHWDMNFDLIKVKNGTFRHVQKLCRKVDPSVGEIDWFKLLPETSLFLSHSHCVSSNLHLDIQAINARFKPLWVIFQAEATIHKNQHEKLTFSLPSLSPFKTLDGIYTKYSY
ncbi:hypothetical protein DSO57_1000052 [Entomophthora muscae]|uniref:Uncharacterized protein n=1 Tax=Entomophthora muscae TaxID=34485 RepID=A0ACC2SMH2_9FUNG|nr:hypothetical protein DSO57_1000052 [Entomophthora muscae]